LRPLGKQYFDVHLMLDNPHLYVEAFAKAGAQSITIHTEPDYPIEQTLEHIRALGCEPAICINPHTPAEDLLPYLHHVHMVLLMSVQPGFGGQSFQSNVLDKISQVDLWRKEMSLDLRIEVDGGINIETARLCRERGADTFVAGTAFFKAADKKQFVRDICGQ